jgi:hypothetical protein
MVMPSRLRAFYTAHPEMSPQAPVDEVFEGSKRYKRARGIDQPDFTRAEYRSIERSPLQPHIARAYINAPEWDNDAVPAFKAFREENERQFDFLTKSRGRGGLGLDFSVHADDPYPDPHAMMSDVREGRIKVLSTETTGGHPFLSNEENDRFRAVHDVFGHAGSGRGFDRHGEEAAWMAHSRMYPGLAQSAMSTELRGQTAVLIETGDFPNNKVAQLPRAYTDPSRSTLLGRRNAAFRGVVR